MLRLAKTSEGADNKIINAMDRSLSEDERVLIRVNERLRNLKVGFNYPNYGAFIESWNFKEGRSKLQHMNGDQLYRQFTDEDGSAGRLYGHWVQNCPSTLCLAPYTRPLIFGFSNKVSGTGGRMFNA